MLPKKLHQLNLNLYLVIMDNEYIICSAIFFDDNQKHVHTPKNIDTGFVICGHRHHNVFAILKILECNRLKYADNIQGFLTNTNRFVDRIEGLEIAKNANQIVNEAKSGELYSENLY